MHTVLKSAAVAVFLAQFAFSNPIPVDPAAVTVTPLDFPWTGGGPPAVLPTTGQVRYDNLTTWDSGLNDGGFPGGYIFVPPPPNPPEEALWGGDDLHMEGGSTFNEVHFIYYTPGPVGSPGPDLTLAFWPNTGGVDGDAWPAVIEPPSAAFSLPTLPGHDGHGSEPDNGSVWLATVSLPVTVDLGTSNIWMGLQAQNAVVGAGNAGYAFSDKDAAVGHTHDFFFQVPGFTQFGNPLDFYGSFAYGLSFIPEPSTAALLAIGLAGIGVRRHRARGEGGNHQYCSALAMHVAGD